MNYLDVSVPVSENEIRIIDGYVGRGYALSRPEELEFIREVAGMEGVIFDPVYTGKAMYGLTMEIKKGTFRDYKNILFIHTGGLYGLFPQGNLFEF
jgi:D-cysteine desulfhydrase